MTGRRPVFGNRYEVFMGRIDDPSLFYRITGIDGTQSMDAISELYLEFVIREGVKSRKVSMVPPLFEGLFENFMCHGYSRFFLSLQNRIAFPGNRMKNLSCME